LSIKSFEKNENSEFIWIIDNQQKVKILKGNQSICCNPHFKSDSISNCKWINKNTLVCGTSSGRLLFGRIMNNELSFITSWKVSDKSIINIQCCSFGISLACIDEANRLYQFCLRGVLNQEITHFSRELSFTSQSLFSNISKISFHPKKPKILIIFKKFPRNEIIFYNLSTKHVIHKKQLISQTHSFSFHDQLNVIFLSQSSGAKHFISIYHLSYDFKKWWRQGRLGLDKSIFEYRNLQIKNGLLVATTKTQKLFIWKQGEIVNSLQKTPSPSSCINGNNLLR
jgi:hypothetical protein